MPAAARAHALTADFRFRPQGHVNNAPFPAGHGAEKERLLRLLHAFASGLRAQPQFFDPQQTVIVGIEHDQRMVLMRQAQHFHRQVLQREQQFRLVFQEQFRLGTGKSNHDVGIFDFGVVGSPFLKLVINVDVDTVEQDVEEIPDFVFVLFD